MSDLIKRADAIEAICMNDCGGCRPNECGAYLDKSCDVVKALSALPSADAVSRKAKCCPIAETCMSIDCPVSSEYIGRPSAEAVQGEWIKHKGKWVDFDFYPTKYECNQCHYCVDEGYDSIFCPNCGARMKGGEDE